VPPIVLTLLQGLFLLLLYVFVGRAVRAVVRDVRGVPAPAAAVPARAAAPAPTKRRGRRQRPRTPPRELVIHRPQGRPSVVPLDGTDITFGRSPSATVRLDDGYVSERHARVYREGDEWLVSDLGSTNGTLLNQVKVTSPTPIAAGDQLRIGKTVIEVRK